jgi:hypothetical protein
MRSKKKQSVGRGGVDISERMTDQLPMRQISEKHFLVFICLSVFVFAYFFRIKVGYGNTEWMVEHQITLCLLSNKYLSLFLLLVVVIRIRL